MSLSNPNISLSPDIEGLLSAYKRLREYHLPLESQDTLLEIDGYLTSLCNLINSLVTENHQIKQSAQLASDTRQQFISQVSHELRTPLTAIKGYSDLLIRNAVGPLNEAQRKFLGVIINNVDRMAGLLTHLTDLSNLESGRLRIQPVLSSIHDLIEQSLRLILPKIQEKRQYFNIDLPPNLPEVYVDPHRFGQVFSNLIDNAHLYTPSDGRISIHANQHGDQIRIEVTDSGYGISPEDIIHLFTPFFRSENPFVRQETGWGLGLYLSKLLVERMGGEMGVTSNYAVGSTFWFTLPIKYTLPNL